MKNKVYQNSLEKSYVLKVPFLIGALTMIALFFTACDNDTGSSDEEFSSSIVLEAEELAEIEDTNENINEIIENTYLEVAISDFFKSSDYKNQPDRRFLSDCVLISKNLKEGLWEIILDYGEGCSTKKGHEVKGKINILVNLDLEASTILMNYSFDDFYMNNKKIEGSVEKQRSRTNERGNPQAKVNRNIKIIWEDGTYITIEGQRTREWIDGSDNDLWSDNVFLITGNWKITKKDGTVYLYNIIEPLTRTLACRFITSGIVAIEKGDTLSQLDYGNGECDDLATLTKQNESYEIHIRRSKKS